MLVTVIDFKGEFNAIHGPYLTGIIQPFTVWHFLTYLKNLQKIKEKGNLSQSDFADVPFIYLTSDEELIKKYPRSVEYLKSNKNAALKDGGKIKQNLTIILLFSDNKNVEILENLRKAKRFAGTNVLNIEIKTKTLQIEDLNDLIKFLRKNYGRKKILFSVEEIQNKKYSMKEFLMFLDGQNEITKKNKAVAIPIIKGYRKIAEGEKYDFGENILDLCLTKRINRISSDSADKPNFYDILPILKPQISQDEITFDFFLLEKIFEEEDEW